jgi:mannose/fructose-specific phosphotransferase system component IIA
MSEGLRGVVVCHGRLADALVEAAEQISGVTGALAAVSNTGCDRGALEERVAEAVGAGPAVVFVDLSSGSCLFAVLKRLRSGGMAKVVTGVNLAMLVDFVFHRTLALDEAGGSGGKARGEGSRVP